MREEKDKLSKEPRKQIFKFKAFSKLKTNIMSLKCYETMDRIDRLKPADPEFVLQRKNGTFHEIIGKTYKTMRLKDEWRDLKFYVIGTLSVNAYLNKSTISAISHSLFFGSIWSKWFKNTEIQFLIKILLINIKQQKDNKMMNWFSWKTTFDDE